jgi:transcriptional regulator GlxA family with amidase domain
MDVSQTVMQLLTSAQEVLARNPDRAGQYLKQATQLLGLTGEAPPTYPTGGLAPWQLRAVRNYVVANIDDNLTNEKLAEQARLSPGHFSRAFKVSMGVAPHAFILRERIERAKDLILGSSVPLSEIALCCGFADQSHFTRMFRRHEGLSPSSWRRINLRHLMLCEPAD